MQSIIAVLILAIILVAGIGIVALLAYKTVKTQQEMILNIVMFKKASDPFQLEMMRAAMDATKKIELEPQVIEDPNDQPSIPQNPSDEAMATFRSML